jgi:hypothetical protein
VATEAAWLNGKEEERKKREKEKKRKNERKGLTLTGLLMEGVGGPLWPILVAVRP